MGLKGDKGIPHQKKKDCKRVQGYEICPVGSGKKLRGRTQGGGCREGLLERKGKGGPHDGRGLRRNRGPQMFEGKIHIRKKEKKFGGGEHRKHKKRKKGLAVEICVCQKGSRFFQLLLGKTSDRLP